MNSASPTQVAAYLARIGFMGASRIDLRTLSEVHRCHVEAIAWECFDCYAGRPTTRDPNDAYDKIVVRGRGGWCYEMNGLFAWMLEALGFDVTRLAAGVMREALGDGVVGNHLALIVRLDRDYLADVGLGSGLIEPIPLAEGTYRQRFATFRLERLDARWWRFHNQPNVMPPSFDFALDTRDEALLEDRCRWLQTDPASPFRQNAVVQRYGADRLESLIGPSFLRVDGDGVRRLPINSASHYEHVLRQSFGLQLQDAAQMWSRIGDAPASVPASVTQTARGPETTH